MVNKEGNLTIEQRELFDSTCSNFKGSGINFLIPHSYTRYPILKDLIVNLRKRNGETHLILRSVKNRKGVSDES